MIDAYFLLNWCVIFLFQTKVGDYVYFLLNLIFIMNCMAKTTQITILKKRWSKKLEFHNELHGQKNTDNYIQQEMVENKDWRNVILHVFG